MTFKLEKSTNINLYPSTWKLELEIEDYGINKVSIMQELIDKYGFEVLFNALCEHELKELHLELDKRLKGL